MIADLPSQFQWLLRRVRVRMDALLAGTRPPAVEIEATAGLLHGNTASFEQTKIALGAGVANDSQVFDDGVAEDHAVLHLRRSIFGTLATAHTGGGGISFAGEDVPPHAVSDEYLLPLDMTLGDAVLRIRTARISEVPTALIVGAASVAGLAAFALVMALVSPSTGQNRAFRAVDTATAPANAAGGGAATPVDMAAQIRTRLGEMQLDPYLEHGPGSNGTVVVSGVIPERLLGNWKRFSEWYDEQPDAPVLVRRVSVAEGLSDLPPIALVQLHDPTRVVFANGRVSGPGDVVFDGWAIKEIDPEALTLTRSGERIRVAY